MLTTCIVGQTEDISHSPSLFCNGGQTRTKQLNSRKNKWFYFINNKWQIVGFGLSANSSLSFSRWWIFYSWVIETLLSLFSRLSCPPIWFYSFIHLYFHFSNCSPTTHFILATDKGLRTVSCYLIMSGILTCCRVSMESGLELAFPICQVLNAQTQENYIWKKKVTRLCWFSKDKKYFRALIGLLCIIQYMSIY